MEAYRGVEVYLRAFFDLGTRWRWVVSFTPGPFYPQGKSPWYPLDRRLDGSQSRSGCGGEEKNSEPPAGNRTLEPRSSSPYPSERCTDWAITFLGTNILPLFITVLTYTPNSRNNPFFPLFKITNIKCYLPLLG
jgi:hypothetical protein